jgi:hypothetical protein
MPVLHPYKTAGMIIVIAYIGTRYYYFWGKTGRQNIELLGFPLFGGFMRSVHEIPCNEGIIAESCRLRVSSPKLLNGFQLNLVLIPYYKKFL